MADIKINQITPVAASALHGLDKFLVIDRRADNDTNSDSFPAKATTVQSLLAESALADADIRGALARLTGENRLDARAVKNALRFRGTWSSGSTYELGDIVRYSATNIIDNGYFLCISITPPPSDVAPYVQGSASGNWELLNQAPRRLNAPQGFTVANGTTWTTVTLTTNFATELNPRDTIIITFKIQGVAGVSRVGFVQFRYCVRTITNLRRVPATVTAANVDGDYDFIANFMPRHSNSTGAIIFYLAQGAEIDSGQELKIATSNTGAQSFTDFIVEVF